MRLYNIGIELRSGNLEKGRFAKYGSKLRRLKKNKLQSLLRIDTLCIPVNERSLRMMAINSMARIYAAAQSIVILDHELEQLSFKTTSRSEIFGNLFCSAWASRCWTFQEGAMAKEWIVQFNDGLCSIDSLFKTQPESLRERLGDSFPYPPPGSDEELVSSDVVKWFSKMPRLQGVAGQYTFSPQSRVLSFLEIWNNLCLRTTTKKDDVICIVAIMLDLRPSEVQALPAKHRLLAIFNSQEKLPLGLLFREREDITSWQQARRWLPTNIEERSADQTESFLRRRSTDENFFVFECSPAQRFYFAKVEMGNQRSLYLMKPPSNEALIVRFLLSENLELPEMDICIMMSDSLAWLPYQDRDEIIGHSAFNERLHIEEVTEAFGVCMGIRKATDDFVQFFYICPVKYISDYSGVMREDMVLVSADKTPRLKVGMECVIEHDFSPTMELYQSRPPFTLSDRLRLGVVILFLPYSTILIFWICCYFAVLLLKNYSYPWIFFVVCIRYLPFAIELGVIVESISQVEFDAWFRVLYLDKVNIPSTAFYVHYRPAITIGVFVLSGLLLPLSLWFHNGDDTWFLVLRCVYIELGVLLLRWLLELYAHAPAKINILLALTSVAKNKQQIMPYYDIFYAPSRLTLYLHCLELKMRRYLERRRKFQSTADGERILEEADSDSAPVVLEEAEGQLEELQSLTGAEGTGINKGKHIDQEPWQNNPVGTYSSNIQQRILDIQSSGRSAQHLDPLAPLHYLPSLLFNPYFLLADFWVVWALIFQVGLRGNPRICLVIFVCIQSIWTPVEGLLFARRIKRVVAQDRTSRPSLSQLNVSIHYHPIITVPVLVLMPIFLALGFTIDGGIFITIGLVLEVQSMQLGLRYFVEFFARGMGSPNILGAGLRKANDSAVGVGNEDLDACYHMLYRASLLTRWLEKVHKLLFPAAKTYSYWDRMEAQNSIRLSNVENDTHSGQVGGEASEGSAGDAASENHEEETDRRGFWDRFSRACESGTVAGRQAVKPLARGARAVLKPLYFVAARALVTMDDVARTSIRLGNSRVGARRDEYADDGENLLSEDFSS